MENFTCEMCKYIDEECDGDHCSKCIWQRYTMFKLDYVKQIAKDFNCSRSIAKEMYHSMIVRYRILKKGGKRNVFK